jgi:hypothetical protein
MIESNDEFPNESTAFRTDFGIAAPFLDDCLVIAPILIVVVAISGPDDPIRPNEFFVGASWSRFALTCCCD